MSYDKDRANHSLVVAQLMYDTALHLYKDEQYAREMFQLGLLHDIGYQFTDNNAEHNIVGGEFLRVQNYKYWLEVREHGNPDTYTGTNELKLLNYADMTVDSKGNRVGFKLRLEEIRRRYGESSEVYKRAKRVTENSTLCSV